MSSLVGGELMCFRLVKAAGGTVAKSFRAGPESPSHLLPTDAGGIQNPVAQRKMPPWSRGKKLEAKVWIAAVYTTCFALSHLSGISSETIVSTEAGDS